MELAKVDVEVVSLGLVYSQRGLNYYSIMVVDQARNYEKFLLQLGCTIQSVHVLYTKEEMDRFIQLENDYRKNVWSAMSKAHLH